MTEVGTAIQSLQMETLCMLFVFANPGRLMYLPGVPFDAFASAPFLFSFDFFNSNACFYVTNWQYPTIQQRQGEQSSVGATEMLLDVECKT